MRILLVGNGGREHALAWRLVRSPSVVQVNCPGGNPGIAQIATALPTVPRSNPEWVDFARDYRADLVV
ncbi:MAG: phosphoribosylamine--glycine ligase, partial [Candidatus Sumerlaeia bacterium]|nr:phosphoribosylamine--glycine ligase [Candidatus Sumerlaeia bacterium]